MRLRSFDFGQTLLFRGFYVCVFICLPWLEVIANQVITLPSTSASLNGSLGT